MFNLESCKTLKITEKLAREFDEMTPVKNERPRSERRLQVYEKLVRQGSFRPCLWAKVFCDETNETYRVNGQHTARLFTTLCAEFPDQVATIESYTAPSLEDVGRLYGTFDASIQSRSASDINRAFASTIPELAEMPRKIIDSCAMGMTLHSIGGVMGGSYAGITPQDRAENLIDHPEFVLFVREIITDTSKHKFLARGGVVAAIYGSWLKAKKDSATFWTAVRDETGTSPTCPDRQLARWLMVTACRPSSESPKTRKADAREFYVRCIHCWNSWRKSEELKLIKYHASSKAPAFV